VSNVTHSAVFKCALVAGALVAGALTTAPLLRTLHAAHAPRTGEATAANPSGFAGGIAPARGARPAITLDELHRFFASLIPWPHTERIAAPAPEEKKDDKPKPLSGTWVKKEGELKIEFAETELKIYPHGDKKEIVLTCSHTRDKDGTIKAKVTGIDGPEEAKMKIAEKIPIGTKFAFQWKVNKDTATLSEVKGEREDHLKPHLEGEFEEKK
jgi:hypothetical protein